MYETPNNVWIAYYRYYFDPTVNLWRKRTIQTIVRLVNSNILIDIIVRYLKWQDKKITFTIATFCWDKCSGNIQTCSQKFFFFDIFTLKKDFKLSTQREYTL